MSYALGSPLIRTVRLVLTGINLNSALTDVGTFTIPAATTKYRVVRLMGYDASVSLTLATVDLRTATGGGGTAIVNAGVLSALTAATAFSDVTLAVTAVYQTAATLTLRNVTAQGAAATASFLLELIDLT
jgi:hypothetical protein